MIFRPTALGWPFDLRLLSFPTARPLTAVYWSVLSGRTGIEKRKFNDHCPAANLKISVSGHAIADIETRFLTGGSTLVNGYCRAD